MINYDKPIRKISIDKTIGYCYFMDAEHPLANRSNKVYHHRHVLSLSIGRWIKSNESVHHVDGDKTNNSIENLLLMNNAEHARHHHPRMTEEMSCELCGKLFFPHAKHVRRFCSFECREKSNFTRKFLVTREELHNDVWSMPTTKVAEKYGVSDKAIDKRCKKLGVEKPPRGYWSKIKYGQIKHEIPELNQNTLV
jgi:hypothetical protein